jgi:hypothetical protein
MIRGFLALIWGLAFAATLAAAEVPPCEMKAIASLDVELDGDGTVLVPATANGREVWMILALNQGLPVLFASAIEELKLPTRGVAIPVTTMGKPIRTVATVNQLLVGRVKYDGLEMLVMPAEATGARTYRGKPLIGTLSSRMLQSVDMEIDLSRRKVNLFSPTRCGGGAIYWGAEFTAVRLYVDGAGLMLFPMELEAKLVETSFNTTSRDSRISSRVTKRFFGFDESSPDIHKEQSGGREVNSYRAMALTAKGLEVRNSRIRLIDLKGCEANYSARPQRPIGCGNVMNASPFSIGTDLLGKLRVYIATKEEMVYFTRADSSTPAPQ